MPLLRTKKKKKNGSFLIQSSMLDLTVPILVFTDIMITKTLL